MYCDFKNLYQETLTECWQAYHGYMYNIWGVYQDHLGQVTFQVSSQL